MAEQFLFKDVFHEANLRVLAETVQGNYEAFDVEAFLSYVFVDFEDLSLSERSSRIASALKQFIAVDFAEACGVLMAGFGEPLVDEDLGHHAAFIYMPLAEFVARNGLQEFEVSMKTLYEITRRFTSEFAIRHFLIAEPERTLAQLHLWVADPCQHVRRLVSEGSRPRLPWSMKLQPFIDDLEPVLELLSLLKDADERYVQRSIANNLNDIAKDHTDKVVETLLAWESEGWRNNWLKKHALRSLLKSGHRGALAALGFVADGVECSSIRLANSKIDLGESLEFSFDLSASEKSKVMVDFIVHHVKANGKLSPKVFKLKSCEFVGEMSFSKKHPMRLITTRKYYTGRHLLEVQVNGRVLSSCEFYLNCKL